MCITEAHERSAETAQDEDNLQSYDQSLNCKRFQADKLTSWTVTVFALR